MPGCGAVYNNYSIYSCFLSLENLIVFLLDIPPCVQYMLRLAAHTQQINRCEWMVLSIGFLSDYKARLYRVV